MNVLLSPLPPVFPHQQQNPRLSPQISVSPLQNMSNRKRKADQDGDESMASGSPSLSARTIARPSKKTRSNNAVSRRLALPRLLETLDTEQLRSALEAICERHPQIEHEVVTEAPRPTIDSVMEVLGRYRQKLKDTVPYGETSQEYTYYRVKDALVAMLDALSDFTPQFLPPIETQDSNALQYLNQATAFIHELPDWDNQEYRYHKEDAYQDIARAWAVVINEAAKRGGGMRLHSDGWEEALKTHHARSGGRLQVAMEAMNENLQWMGAAANNNEQTSILDQIVSGAFGSPVRVGP